MRGRGWVVRTINAKPFQPRSHPVLAVGIDVSRQILIESAGAAPKRFPGGRNQLTLFVDRTAHGWEVGRLERLS